ncbi:dihydrolipoyl dehydrogenase [Leptospira kmetyi]|uniref:Dihydrolipoyl dehydrogenase n=2 Tax=Leptospira kmetyi TaxID=408139 RepID=A0A5F1XKW2_9LEPT|nr:dihydrolipoyl dehydrogenase [Leptospira kmetyi]AYV54773.1 dihydrolipoyl dehydrogenase [Leptospira kmetyi]EQA54613.1 dihydrolipoyl dehydrogenase [Leptospira kmetyi serovar Malaysia str. Bejo-Iso9]TGK13568.1 dihydrolipoyl dehydrogenase [Leptospira kmetyi]TGK31282.1 dihydrolipoyl dehydrogenase [Leptospira kmetyi]
MPESYDLTVIGAGPGGYVAAIRGAQLGMNVCVIEKERPGGICLNWGCIPTKALLESAHLLEKIHSAKEFGIDLSGAKPDFPSIISRSRKVADTMANGVEFLLNKNKITRKKGTAVFKDSNTIWLPDTSKEEITSKYFILATGARARELPGLPFDGQTVLSSKTAMIQEKIPESLLIVGAGAIGVEFADFYAAMGTKVTLVEMLDQILPVEDREISSFLEKSFLKRGIRVLTGVGVSEPKLENGKVKVLLKGNNLPPTGESFEAEKILVSIGLVPNTDSMNLEEIGIFLQKGFVKTDTKYKTSVSHIYAIGDCNGPPLLAHVASMEGIKAAEAISIHAGNPHRLDYIPIDYNAIPGCTYCHPEVASIGLTEKKATDMGYTISVGKFPFIASGRAQAMGDAGGFTKVVIDKSSGEILGAHLIGPGVTELLPAVALGITQELTAKEIASTIFAHPTLSETVMESFGASLGEAINL